ncbi:MAG: hypothetical protein ACOYJ1_08295 [Peptococcales bacterium]
MGAEFCSIPYNSCNLGSINLTKCVDDNRKFNLQKFKTLVNNSVRFLDNMITVNKLPLKEIEEVTKGVRSVGLGVMGFSDCLYKLGLKYNSEEAYEFANILFDEMYARARNISHDLAQEKGAYKLIKGSTWESRPVRNSNFLSIAPTGSISFLANVSSGIEPNFGLVYTRTTFNGDEYYVVNEVFKEELIKRNLYNDNLLEKIANNHGSCIGISEIPKDMQDIFVTAHDISPEDHVEMVGTIQQWIDLSTAKTVNLPSEATVEDVMDVYMLAWKQRIKGITISNGRLM